MTHKGYIVICTLVCLALQATGTLREHKKFTVKELAEIAPKLIEEVSNAHTRKCAD